MTSHSIFAPRRLPSAFTLIEILVVVALIALLLAVSGLGIGSSINAMQLSAAAGNLNATLNHAALLARKENRPVQVRFYKFSTLENPESQFRAYQLAALDGIASNGSAEIRLLSEITHLPGGIIMASTAAYNTVAGLAEQPQTSGDPDFGHSYTYTSYEIRPDGLTTLPKAGPAVITVLLESQNTNGAKLPPNYRSIVLNPLNARARIY